MLQVFKKGEVPVEQWRPLTFVSGPEAGATSGQATGQAKAQTESAGPAESDLAPSPPALIAALEQQLAEAQAATSAAEQAAYERGHAEGRASAEQDVNTRIEAELAPMRQQLADTLEEVSGLRAQLFRQHEREIIELAVAIARKIVQREVTVDREIVLAIAKVALARLSDHTAATIHVHPFDYQYLINNKGAFLTAKQGTVDIIEDRSITRGGCLIETDVGQVDARIEEQFREIEMGFFE